MKKLLVLLMALMMMGTAGIAGAEETAEAAAQVPDLDLTNMSGTFVYAQINQMVMDPYTYVDRIIRMKGYYEAYEDSSTGMYYTACVVPDATACCAQGIEFVWAGEHAYPDDYPLMGTDIIVTGRFELYEENGQLYIHLADADMETVEQEGA